MVSTIEVTMVEILPSFVSSASVDNIASMLVAAAQTRSGGRTIMLNALGQAAVAPYAQFLSRPDGASVTFYRQDAAPTELEDGAQEYSPLDEVIDVRLQILDRGTKVTFSLQDETYRPEMEYFLSLFSRKHEGHNNAEEELGDEPTPTTVKRRAPGRHVLKCNLWLWEEFQKGRSYNELANEYQKLHMAETGYEVIDAPQTMKKAIKRFQKGGKKQGRKQQTD